MLGINNRGNKSHCVHFVFGDTFFILELMEFSCVYMNLIHEFANIMLFSYSYIIDLELVKHLKTAKSRFSYAVT